MSLAMSALLSRRALDYASRPDRLAIPFRETYLLRARNLEQGQSAGRQPGFLLSGGIVSQPPPCEARALTTLEERARIQPVAATFLPGSPRSRRQVLRVGSYTGPLYVRGQSITSAPGRGALAPPLHFPYPPPQRYSRLPALPGYSLNTTAHRRAGSSYPTRANRRDFITGHRAVAHGPAPMGCRRSRTGTCLM